MLSDRFCFPIGVSKMRALMSINVKCLYQKMYFPCTRRERNNLPFLCVCVPLIEVMVTGSHIVFFSL